MCIINDDGNKPVGINILIESSEVAQTKIRDLSEARHKRKIRDLPEARYKRREDTSLDNYNSTSPSFEVTVRAYLYIPTQIHIHVIIILCGTSIKRHTATPYEISPRRFRVKSRSVKSPETLSSPCCVSEHRDTLCIRVCMSHM